ncbi:microtubule-associated tumor suppressor candidate 2 homolog isoform X1 [Schistocerca americana]|uniref:microtubule-associated tumor suppressor candidate 2 homolog isoform X1 n=1 Tax=Schistocerca americana TaxID=7009 RepID=UPI001F4F2860|nr:microtubule-associated tumor suppressor candidate 2 homolog isoform X1 [Schistocerca americana]
MTDSDFFTESDADGHEEARAPPPAAAPAAHEEPPSSSSSSAATGCGDRRAQVIDGTLYNESQRLQQRCPSFTASSEMESSGVFSDLEPRRPEDGDADADDASAAHDASPSGSTGSVSEHSQEEEAQSPTGSNVTASTTVIPEESSLEEAERALTEENNLKNLSSPVITELAAPQTPTTTPPAAEAAPQDQPKPAAGAKPRELKKFKMPKRNVVSKIKAMIEAPAPQPQPHEDQENQRPAHKPKKGGRWDAVMSKIAQGQAEQRVLKSHLKEVKSKVFAGLGAPPAPDSTTARRKAATPTSPAVTALERAGSADSTTPTRTKSRRPRTRASPISQTLPLSGHSSVRSSVSDVSGEHASPATPSCKSVSSLRSAKKRADTTRANSPLSDGSLNSSASHQPARRQNQQSAARARTHSVKGSGASGGRSSKHLVATARVLKDSSRNNKLVSQRSTEEKNGVPDMKTPVARKPASRRSAPVTTPAKPQPLRDHNRVAGSGAPLKEPAGKLQPQLQAAPAVPTRAQLQQLRHSATGFEAFAVLVQYLVNDTEEKRCQYEDEISRLECLHSEREAALLQDGLSKLQQAEAEHKHQLRESEQRAKDLRERLEAADAETARLQQQVEDLVSRDHEAQLQTEQTRCRYEGEISRLERLHAEREAALLEDGVMRLRQAEAEHKRQLSESEQRAAELRVRLEAADAETAHLQQQVAGLVSGLRQDRDAQLQVTAGRCHDLEEEVRSLRTVLDLRHEELAEVRKQNAELAKDAGELPGALQRIATLQARVEDLQEQLQHKVDFERQLSQENRKLNESFHHVAVQKQRLSQHNEELQWKLKQSTEAVHVITQALTSTPISHNNHKTNRKLIDSFHDYSQAFPEISKSYTKLSSRSPLMQRRCDLSNTPVMHHDLEHPSPPASPKVKAVVEKSDSVSWVLDMDESPEAKVSRLVRRAGSFRGSSGLSPPSTAQSQTLPRSRGASGPGNRRSTGTSAGRSRTRAWSVSSSDNFVSCWGSSGTCATSAPVTMQRSVSGTPSPVAHSYGEDNYTVSPGKTPLKRCSRDPDECSVNGDEDDDDDMRQHHNANGSVAKRSNADSGPSSLDGQLLSLRTCGSSNSSSASPPGSNTCSSTSSCSEAEHNYRHLNGTIIYRQVETETADMRVVPIPHLPGSSDLSILAAACAAAKPLMGAPKDAAGEAMISEETLDNENDGDGGDTSSDGEDPQSWENVGLLPSDNEA